MGSHTPISDLIPPALMSPIPVMTPVPEMAEAGAGKRSGSRRASNVSMGRRSRLGSESAGAGMGLEGGNVTEKAQVIRELRTRLNSLKAENSMRSSFDVSDFLEEKEFDIFGKTYKDIFPLISGPDAEELTS